MGPMHPYYDSWIDRILPILLGFIIVLLLLVIVYLWINRKKEDIQETIKVGSKIEDASLDKIDVAIRLLNDNEGLIVLSLIDHGGEMLQKDISIELGLSRVQVHRSIQSLLERDMVTAEDYFNTKKVSLSKWLITG